MSQGSFQSLDVSFARAALERLFDQVICGRGRVEITRSGSDDTCVLISKSELESFERALEILSGNDRGLEMHQLMLRLAGELSDQHSAMPATSGAG